MKEHEEFVGFREFVAKLACEDCPSIVGDVIEQARRMLDLNDDMAFEEDARKYVDTPVSLWEDVDAEIKRSTAQFCALALYGLYEESMKNENKKGGEQ